MGLLYTKMKVFHYRDKVDSLPREVPEILAPLHVRVKPTNVCNHNCWYCAYRKENIQLGKDMAIKDHIPREKMQEIVGDFAAMGVQAVTFSGGGEPLCYPYLTETLRALAASDIRFAALTNGAKLRGENAELFAHHGTWVRVSMDGWDGPSYAKYRGVSEREFAQVMDSLEGFKRLGGSCYLGVVIIVDETNAAHVYEMIDKLKDTGANSVKVSPCIVSNDGEECNAYHRPYFAQVGEQIDRAVSDFASEQFEVFNGYGEQLTTFEKSYTWCPYVQINPVIGADLNVYSCHDKAYNLDEGLICSIREQSFRAAWLKDKSKFFRINPSRDCAHHCVVNDKNKMILEYLDSDPGHVMFV
jgi:MoaA/NifB/PqqE/SkfB family radical SAM enzyme